MTSTVFTIRVPEQIKSQLELLAKATNRSKSHIVNKAIEDYVRRNAWNAKALQDAIREANQGDFIPNEAIKSWLDSWGTKHEKTAPLKQAAKAKANAVTKSKKK